MAPTSASASLWSEYKNADGRTYWSNSKTKQSVWEKPDDLRTPFERALAKTDWKQYLSKDRPYYVNSKTKETKWDLPEELVRLKRRVEREEKWEEERDMRRRKGLPSPTPPPRTPSPTRSITPTDLNIVAAYVPPAPPRAKTPPPRWPIGGFLKYEAAEDAFMRLLKFYDVDEHSAWEETHRKIITHELYKALDTLAEKKAAFEKFQRKIVDDRNAAKAARVEKLRPALLGLFAATPQIRSWSTTKTANAVFRREKLWVTAEPDERASILHDYTADLRAKEEADERDLRARNIDTLTKLVRQLDITVSTRWRQAHDVIVSSPAFKADDQLQKIDMVDILDVYDAYARELEKEHEEESRAYRIRKIREARKARDGFRELLHELRDKGELTRLSKWKDLYPAIKADERYDALLGKSGSNPLELWMDAVDDLGEETERAAEKILRAFKGVSKEIKGDTSVEEFEEWVKEAHLDSQVEAKLRKDAHDLITSRIKQAAADEKRRAEQEKADELRRAERKRRHRIEDLRYALKLTKITHEMSWDEALPIMQGLDEWKDVEDEEDRKGAFEKHIKRLKEKAREESEAGSERRYSRTRREEPDDEEEEYEHRDKDRRRDKDKDRYKDKEDRYRDRDRDDGERRNDRYKDESRRDRERERERDRDRRDSTREERRDRSRGGGGDHAREKSSASASARKAYDRGSADIEDRDRDSKRRRMSSGAIPAGDALENGRGNGNGSAREKEREAGEVEEGEI